MLSTGTNAINQFTTTVVPSTRVTSTSYTLVNVDLSSYSGQGYVAIRHTAAADQASLWVDDITIVEGEAVNPGYATETYTYGQTCVATATPNTGYHFVNWSNNLFSIFIYMLFCIVFQNFKRVFTYTVNLRLLKTRREKE